MAAEICTGTLSKAILQLDLVAVAVAAAAAPAELCRCIQYLAVTCLLVVKLVQRCLSSKLERLLTAAFLLIQETGQGHVQMAVLHDVIDGKSDLLGKLTANLALHVCIQSAICRLLLEPLMFPDTDIFTMLQVFSLSYAMSVCDMWVSVQVHW